MVMTRSVASQARRSAGDSEIEDGRAERRHQPDPERQYHLEATSGSDVAKIDDAGGLPAEPFAEPAGNLRAGARIVAGGVDDMVTRHALRCHHDSVVHRVQRFHDLRLRKRALDLLAERIGVA